MQERDFCLVLISDKSEYKNLWDIVIEPTLRNSNLEAIKCYEIKRNNEDPSKAVREHIINAKVIIAVLTDTNPTVIYNLGLAHSAKKNVIIMEEIGKKLPEYFPHFRYLEYDLNALKDSQDELTKWLENSKANIGFSDTFPELITQDRELIKEVEYLRATKKELKVVVTPSECSIFFNNKLLGKSPQTIYVNPNAEKNVLAISAVSYFEHYQIFTKNDLEKNILEIKLERKEHVLNLNKSLETENYFLNYIGRVNQWLKYRRDDSNSVVLSAAICSYFVYQKEYVLAKEEIKFCIEKAPNWYYGYHILGAIENILENYNEAKEQFKKLVIIDKNHHYGYYNLACVEALLGNNQKAIEYLNKILESKELSLNYKKIYSTLDDYNKYYIETDKELDSLRSNKDFQEIVKKFREIIDSPDEDLITEKSESIKKIEKSVELPIAIKQFKIENYHSIREANNEITDIPIDSQFIFITGYNGAGKTSILQALAIAINGNEYQEGNSKVTIHDIDKSFKTSVELTVGLNNIKWDGDNWTKPKVKIDNFIAYGSDRLTIMAEQSMDKVKEYKNSITNLFQHYTTLLNIEYFFKMMKLEAKENLDADKEKFINRLLEMFASFMPDVDRIEIKGSEIIYYEKDDKYKLDELSHGHRSIMAMIGDMFMRLYKANGDRELKDYAGIVIIDEFETHLHPRMQIKLPKLLSEYFPKVQFIVEVHSPLPFLSAPESSTFIKVERDKENGTTFKKLNITVKNLLPNSILTSPLFDLKKIINCHSNDDFETEDDYKDIEAQKKVQDELNELENDEDLDELERYL